MKRLAFISLILLLIAGCKEAVSLYTLEGVYGNGNDTLYLFGLDNRHDRIDTVTTKNDGTFTYTLETDTIVSLGLLLPSNEILQIFAEPNVNATMKKEDNGWKISGSNIQQQYDSIMAKTESADGARLLQDVIDTFSIHNPYSEINIPLLRRYFIEIPKIRKSIISDKITKLGGTLQDNSYLSNIKSKVSSKNRNITNRILPTFNITLPDSSQITKIKYHDKYLLITFCASWDSAGKQKMRELNRIGAKKDTATFAMLNISLDYDTAHWNRYIAADSIAGDNVCDTKMWENDLVKNYDIESLPFNILVGPYMHILQFNVTSDYLNEELDSFITKHKKVKKEREERRKRNTKRN